MTPPPRTTILDIRPPCTHRSAAGNGVSEGHSKLQRQLRPPGVNTAAPCLIVPEKSAVRYEAAAARAELAHSRRTCAKPNRSRRSVFASIILGVRGFKLKLAFLAAIVRLLSGAGTGY